MYLIKLVRLRIRSQHKVFPFPCLPQKGFRNEQRIQTIQRGFHLESMEAIRKPCATSSSRRGFTAYKNKQQRRSCGLWYDRRYRRRCMQFKAVCIEGGLIVLN